MPTSTDIHTARLGAVHAQDRFADALGPRRGSGRHRALWASDGTLDDPSLASLVADVGAGRFDAPLAALGERPDRIESSPAARELLDAVAARFAARHTLRLRHDLALDYLLTATHPSLGVLLSSHDGLPSIQCLVMSEGLTAKTRAGITAQLNAQVTAAADIDAEAAEAADLCVFELLAHQARQPDAANELLGGGVALSRLAEDFNTDPEHVQRLLDCSFFAELYRLCAVAVEDAETTGDPVVVDAEILALSAVDALCDLLDS